MTSKEHSATHAVRAAIESDTQYGAVVPPLYLSSNFAFNGLDDKRQYDYTRTGNPTRDALADALCALEGGAGAVVTSSGMGALTLLVQLLKPGDLLLAPHDCYGGSYRLFEQLAARGQFDVEFVDQTDSSAFSLACAREPRLILVETPSNPLLRIVDIQAIADIAKGCGALVAVDNTFLSPALQNPLALGADIVVHSTTKYLNGHSDVVGGALIAASTELAEELAWWANCLGLSGAPFDSYLTLRGVRTLHARIRTHEENATLIANALHEHPSVEKVFYPGLASHEGHAIACKQQSGFGGMISFEIAGGEEQVRLFIESLEYFSLAESLGGVESLVCHPVTMTHTAFSDEALATAGISRTLIRLSVGLEHSDDLLRDVLQSLDTASRYRPHAVAAGAAG